MGRISGHTKGNDGMSDGLVKAWHMRMKAWHMRINAFERDYAAELADAHITGERPDLEEHAIDVSVAFAGQTVARLEALTAERDALRAAMAHALTELGQSAQDLHAIRAEAALSRALAQQEGAKG